ncbi:hypothetical protein [Bacillus paramycoides]|uniref:hypothetical protein n=1 Tax=Bacillus paramycoides TaxID=2026194 RepID=UPI0038226884
MAFGSIGVSGVVLVQKSPPAFSEENDVAELVSTKENKTDSVGYSELISVKKSDKDKFREEGWKEVLKKIESGEVYWEE